MITASQVYDHVQCPHRPVMDACTPESERDEASTFTAMLWEQGVEHEAAARTNGRHRRPESGATG